MVSLSHRKKISPWVILQMLSFAFLSVKSRHLTSCHVMSRHVMSRHVIPVASEGTPRTSPSSSIHTGLQPP